MTITYLALGTNLGDKEENLNQAVLQLSLRAGNVLSVSTYMATQPVGFCSENSFLNTVLILETSLTPLDLLLCTQAIEREMGRTSKSEGSYSDCIIDIDILLYDHLYINTPQLKIPHPLMTERDFVLKPLLELAPTLRHPVSGKLFSEYLCE